MKKRKVLTFIVIIIALAINIFILVNACINGEASAQESNQIAHTTADVINTVKPETITQSNFPTFAAKLRKILGHFSLFVASGIFTTWSLVLVGDSKKKFFQVLYSICVGAFIAFLSELFQLFTAGRSGNFRDVGIDVSGYLVGVFLLILIYLIVKLIQKIKSNKKKKSS